MKTNRIQVWAVASLAILCCFSFVSCDRMHNEPVPNKDKIHFTKAGGFTFVDISKHSGKEYEKEAIWWYNYCSDQNNEFVKMDTVTASDGSFKVYNEWIAFTTPSNRRSILVEAQPNMNEKGRFIRFRGRGKFAGFRIEVTQD